MDINKEKRFEIRYKNDDGTYDVWVYDLNKTTKGPIEVISKLGERPSKKKKEKNK